ncbi:MAG: cytochrome P450 [Actinomycetota bacterium]|nr:cytochrome P450 [Actinomycetota bacterium]
MDAAPSVGATDPGDDGGGSPMSAMPPEMAADPQPVYAEFRALPVLPLEGMGVMLTCRAEIDEAFRNPQLFSSNMAAVDLKNARPLIPLQIDPPEHKKYRKILDPLFAPRAMALLEDSVTTLANDLIDRFIDDGEVDFAQRFSIPFPSQVFLTLLGLPLDDLPVFLGMKDGIIRPDWASGHPWGSEGALAHQQATADSLYAYFNRVLDERELAPTDDLLSQFLTFEVEGEKLTRNDILDICFLFLIAGLDTVTATLDCMFSYLARHPEQRDAIVADPSIIPSVVEELLRWETPVMAVVRVATDDTELAGCPIRKGDQVVAMLGSANTDEADLPDANEVRFDREVNRHLAFGGGVHRCLGSHLARQELRIALREWHRRIPTYRVPDGVELVYTPAIRSIEHFPMQFERA